jgi:hypothetical protein
MNIKILDCTLRDGGYINDWNFSDNSINIILSALNSSNIDIIECGYLNNKRGKEHNTTLFNNISTLNKHVNILKESKAKKVVMINLGDYNIDELESSDKSYINGIRLAFHKSDLDKALESSNKIKELGYDVYFQPMITKNYNKIEFLNMIEKVNMLNPHAFYIVDSFGSMIPKEFEQYITLSNENLNNYISLGYHSHNNMQLAFSNTINMCSMNINRNIIIDASIYGIGRGAGNLNTELISNFLNKSFKKEYNTLPLLDIIDKYLNSLMQKNPWGFSPAQFLSATYDCHPNYATYLINKNTINILELKEIIAKIPKNKKVSYDKIYIENLYMDFILEERMKTKENFSFHQDKKVLLIASGKSIFNHQNIVINKVNSDEYITIALNHKTDFECDYYFFTNQKRYDEFKSTLNNKKVILTNNIFSKSDILGVLDFKKLVIKDDIVITNSTILAINYLIQINRKEVEIAGLDGYIMGQDNYSYDEKIIIMDSKSLDEQNNIIRNGLSKLSKLINIKLITPSIFKENS